MAVLMMRSARALAALALAGLVAALTVFAACSNGSPTAAAASADAGPDQPLGQPCNPLLASPCLASTNPCAAISCDPASKTCVENVSAAPSCQGEEDASALVNASCTTSFDCDAGFTCGFPLVEGCSATGTCVAASEGGAQALACSCDGVDVPYVGAGMASEPVASPTPCLDAGEDGSEDSGADPGGDAATDAADAQ
jgi:hypothetical protein